MEPVYDEAAAGLDINRAHAKHKMYFEPPLDWDEKRCVDELKAFGDIGDILLFRSTKKKDWGKRRGGGLAWFRTQSQLMSAIKGLSKEYKASVANDRREGPHPHDVSVLLQQKEVIIPRELKDQLIKTLSEDMKIGG